MSESIYRRSADLGARLIRGVRARPWIVACLFVVAATALTGKVVRTLPNSYDWAKTETYARVDHWIASSECTVKTGALLAYCHDDGRVSGIEAVSIADDAGHTLIANVYALATGKAIDRVAKGFHARVVQHECDHLDGILYPQRMKDLTKLIFESEIKHWPEPEDE